MVRFEERSGRSFNAYVDCEWGLDGVGLRCLVFGWALQMGGSDRQKCRNVPGKEGAKPKLWVAAGGWRGSQSGVRDSLPSALQVDQPRNVVTNRRRPPCCLDMPGKITCRPESCDMAWRSHRSLSRCPPHHRDSCLPLHRAEFLSFVFYGTELSSRSKVVETFV